MNFLREIAWTRPEIADAYDELSLWSAPFGLLLLDRVPFGSGWTILDVGAGTGFLTIELAQRCGAGSKVIAVDPWSAGMDRLRRKLDSLAIDNVALMLADAAVMDVPDASVDLIVSNLGINNFENAAEVLRACHRVAKPGAHFLLTTNLEGHMAEFYEVFRATLVETGCEDRLEALDTHIRHRGTADSVAALVGAGGFTVRDVATDSFTMRFADGSALLRHHFIRLGFIPAWKAVVPADRHEQVFARLEGKLNSLAAKRGVLALTIPMACVTARKDG